MENPKRTKLPSLILSLYKNNIGLFLRIMLPIAIIAIILYISLYYYQVSTIEKINPELQRNQVSNPSQSEENNLDQQENSVSVRVSTNGGISPFPNAIYRLLLSSNELQHPWNPNEIEATDQTPLVWQILPYPMIGNMNDSVVWAWSIPFKSIEYTPLILLIFTLCPLSIVVAFQMQTSNIDQSAGISPLTARSVWKYTSSRALKVLIVPILFLIISEFSQYIYLLLSYIFPSLPVSYAGTPLNLIQMFFNIYFLITLSLYNQCTIFENRSIIGIFKRSHSLVNGVRLKYLSIYLLTAWVASIVSSVFMGSALFVLSIFFSELAPIQDALTPFRFLSLFIGGNVVVMLPDKLSILPTVSILIVSGLVSTLIVPLWAVVTTHLYNERIDSTPKAIEV